MWLLQVPVELVLVELVRVELARVVAARVVLARVELVLVHPAFRLKETSASREAERFHLAEARFFLLRASQPAAAQSRAAFDRPALRDDRRARQPGAS